MSILLVIIAFAIILIGGVFIFTVIKDDKNFDSGDDGIKGWR